MKGLILVCLVILSLTGYSSAFIKTLLNKFSSKHKCPIQLYKSKHSSFTGHNIYANAQTFHPLLDTVSDYANTCHVKINVKQSFIHEDPSKSFLMLREHSSMAFLLGEAIEFELMDRNDKILCNRRCMKKSLQHLAGLTEAQCFLRKLSRNPDLYIDPNQPTIILKRTQLKESLMNLHDKRKQLQKQCKKLQMN